MLKQITFKTKLLFAFILYGSLLTCVAVFTIKEINAYNIKNSNIDKAKIKAEDRINMLHNHIENIHDQLVAIKTSKIFQQFLYQTISKDDTIDLFLNIATTSKYIMQLRYIDTKGNEVIRINRPNIHAKPYIVPQNKLQNKSHRYYFKSIIQIPANQLWHSKIDLNIENGEIQKPFEAVLRVAIPVFKEKTKTGFLIINIFMNDFLESFVDSSAFNIYLIDKNGYFKAHRNKKNMWSRYKKEEYILKDEFPKLYSKILLNNEFVGKNVYSKDIELFTFNDNKIIVQPTYFTIQKEIDIQTKQLMVVMIAMILFSFPIAYLFSKTPASLKEEVDNLNRSLEDKVNQKTAQLQELNKTLELKVEEEVSKNSKKDKLIYQQSKIASLGEMLGNIAHQWRQPLSAISTAASGMKLQKEMDILDDKNFQEMIGLILKNSQYLSRTIDDFRNFFKSDKNMETFNLAESIKNDLNILASTLKNNHIKLIVKLQEDVMIQGLKSELTQVHLNIISNAKDALQNVSNKHLEEKLIFVEMTTTLKEAIITIKDNAGGIDESIIDKIFEPYFTTKHKSQGTGIGLYMSEEIISKHLEGSIEVNNTIYKYNEDLYKGAIFTIKLPLE